MTTKKIDIHSCKVCGVPLATGQVLACSEECYDELMERTGGERDRCFGCYSELPFGDHGFCSASCEDRHWQWHQGIDPHELRYWGNDDE